jgi:hypothetical protein
MANHQPLNNVTHQNLRIKTGFHPDFGDDDSYARLTLDELVHAQSEYPLFFRKQAETGQFEIIAMLGLGEQENLFVNESGWHAHYVPLSVQRRPFLIGFQQAPGQAEPEATVHIDIDSPRISESEGEAVFLEQGGQAPLLQHVNSVLKALHEGLPKVAQFVDVLQNHELIEPVDLNVQLDNGEKLEVGGLYTIQEDNLRDLTADVLGNMHTQGYLKAIYMMVASLQNLSRLIERKNASL